MEAAETNESAATIKDSLKDEVLNSLAVAREILDKIPSLYATEIKESDDPVELLTLARDLQSLKSPLERAIMNVTLINNIVDDLYARAIDKAVASTNIRKDIP